MRLIFLILIGLSALFIAACSAFFSVRGLGLLFAGASVAVMVMAASLEAGKLIAASLLYQYWARLGIAVRCYLMVAVGVLVCITSLGIYGYLAQAYERTHTQIGLNEDKIRGIEAELADVQHRIDDAKNQTGKLSDADRQDIQTLQTQIAQGNQSLEQSLLRLDARRKAAQEKRDQTVDALHKQVDQSGSSLDQSLARLDARRKTSLEKRDKDLAQFTAQQADSSKLLTDALANEDAAVALLNEQTAALDRAVEAYTKQGGPGLFKDDGIRKGQALREQQKPQRDAITAQIAQHHAAQDQLRADHATAVAASDKQMAATRDLFTKESAALDDEEKALRKGKTDSAEGLDAKIAAAGDQFNRETAAIDDEEKTLRKSTADSVAAMTAQLAALQAKGQNVLADGSNQTEAMYQRVRTGREEINRLNEQIASTDVGSYRFVARAMNAPVDDVVKWLMLVIVMVFDPLAVALTIGFNVALLNFVRSRPGGGRQGGVFLHSLAPAGADIAGGSAAGDGAGGSSPSSGAAQSRSVGAIVGVAVVAVLLLAVGAYTIRAFVGGKAEAARGRLVPDDSFAVMAFRPALLNQQGSSNSSAASPAAAMLRPPLAAAVADMLGSGFDLSSDVYAFLKYPAEKSTKPTDRPVILCGLVMPVSDPVAAEMSLSRFADNVAKSLGPTQTGGTLTHSRIMVQAGRGKYLDPEGGFFTFGLTDHEAVVLLEIEGDPMHSRIEQEVRLCLAQDDPSAAPADMSAASAAAHRHALPSGANGAISLWFDAAHCFADMPKTSAAQARYQQLERYLDFDLALVVRQNTAGRLDISGQYTYAGERFRDGDVTAIDVLSKIGPSDAAGIPGRLMDRCADTIEFDSLIERLRAALTGPTPGSPRAQIVVNKTTGSLRDAQFLLTAQYDPKAGPPLVEAFRTLALF